MLNYRQKTKNAYDKIVNSYIKANDIRGESLLKARLKKVYNLQGWDNLEGKKVLELGFGTGRDLALFVANEMSPTNYLGIDISPAMLEYCSERFPDYNLVVDDILTYDFSQKYDLIWASAVLLHLNQADLKKMLKKMRLALSNKGVMMISMRIKQGRDDKKPGLVQSNNDGEEVERYFAYYTPDEFSKILKGNRLNVLGIERKFETDEKTEWMFVYVGT